MAGELRMVPLSALGLGPMSPADPSFRAKIPPPEPDGLGKILGEPSPAGAAVVAPLGPKRVVITYGRVPDSFMVAVEEAPNWDIPEGCLPMHMVEENVVAVLIVLKQLGVKVKNLTGEDFLNE